MELVVRDIGVVSFQDGLRQQRDVFNLVKNERMSACVILCSHKPVITRGRTGKWENILAVGGMLAERGITVESVDRGGDVTYHGPDQLIAYPVLDLNYFKKDVHWYLRCLEQSVVGCLSDFGVGAVLREGFTGAWVGEKKIASIGISVKNWITGHGLALNVYKDSVGGFSMVRPCGMDIQMTCLENQIQRQVPIHLVKGSLVDNFRRIFLQSSRELAYH